MGKALSIVTLAVVGFIIADMAANAGGTKAVFGGLQKIWQIMTDPLNTKGL